MFLKKLCKSKGKKNEDEIENDEEQAWDMLNIYSKKYAIFAVSSSDKNAMFANLFILFHCHFEWLALLAYICLPI